MRFFVKVIIGLFILGVLAVAGVSIFAYSAVQPVNVSQKEKSEFVIPKGQAVSIIANRLQNDGFVRNAVVFRLFVTTQNLAGKLQAGSFELSPSMSTPQIAQRLTEGTDDIWVTVVEGWRVEEIADMFERQKLSDFDKAAFLELAKPDEGYLYPDTYLIQKTITATGAHQLMRTTFDRKVTQDLATEVAAAGATLKDTVIMASIVEREARGYEQMRQVAGVLWNRIHIGMALQADATLSYAKGYNKAEQSWWVAPLSADKQLDSPFNTYKNVGLPPRPIGNPGLDAIRATLNPVSTDDLFYIHDSQGEVHFAETLDEHNANIEKYLR